MADRFARTAGGNWNSNSTWSTTSGGAADTVAPVAADNVFLDANSGDVNINTFVLGRSLDCNGYTGTLTHTSGQELRLGDATGGTGNRVLRLVAGMTYVSNGAIFGFVSGSGTAQTIATAGQTLGRMNFNATGTGGYTISGANTCIGVVTLTDGVMLLNGQACSWLSFSSSNTATRTVTFTGATVTLTDTSATTVWNMATSTNATLSVTNSTIVIAGATTNTRTFAGGGLTYSTLSYTESNSSGALVITGGNTFATLTVTDDTVGKTLTLPSGETTTISTALNINGAAGRLNTLNSSTPGSPATISKTSGTVTVDYVTITDSTATGGATFIAGANAVDGGGNNGWIFPGGGGGSGSTGSMQHRGDLQNLQRL